MPTCTYIDAVRSYICDQAWENQSYPHVKFDLMLRV